MRRFIPILAASLVGILVVSPAHAGDISGSDAAAGTSAFFGTPALADGALASIHGKGLIWSGYLRNTTDDYLEGLDRQAAQVLPATFDTWFHEVGNPIIAANVRAAG